jgi:drug/metabolite transporter (DMT)-like permease
MMLLLLLVSFIWAFSFGLIKRLTGPRSHRGGGLRLAISLVVFIPFFRRAGLARLP